MDKDRIKLQVGAIVRIDPAPEGDLARRAQGLRDSVIAGVYVPLLQVVHEEMSKPVGQRDYSKINAALKVSNITHDRYGRSFWHAAMGVIEDPGASKAAQDAAVEMLKVFLPSRSELALDHATEVANARERAPLVEPNAEALGRVPAADGRSGKHLIEGMVKAAEERALLLLQRGAAPEGPPGDGTVWMRAWGLLNEFRQALGREIETNLALPRDLDKLVFGMMDQIG